MGAYTCEFDVVHKTCRCPTPHQIKCDVPDKHGPEPVPERLCNVMANRMEGFIEKPKHMRVHLPHDWWSVYRYFEVDVEPDPRSTAYPGTKWRCPGMTEEEIHNN